MQNHHPPARSQVDQFPLQTDLQPCSYIPSCNDPHDIVVLELKDNLELATSDSSPNKLVAILKGFVATHFSFGKEARNCYSKVTSWAASSSRSKSYSKSEGE